MMKRWFLLIAWLSALVAQGAWAQLPDFSDLVEKQTPTVVNITTTQEVQAPAKRSPGQKTPKVPEEMLDFFRHFAPGGEMPLRPRHGQGSGLLISTDGFILTNAHVVAEADEVMVKLNDKREFKAKVIGSDTRTDIALIKIEADKLPAASLGDPEKLRVGEWVLAIGAPFGFANSVTAGIVSAKGRSLPDENYVPFIQTDAAVNPGNSGGPLFNLKGEVVGINSQIVSRSGGNMGLAFAIPIDVAMEVADQLKVRGKVNRGRIGVSIQEVTPDLADSFGLKSAKGALVAEVEAGSPADKAGVQVSDIITKFDGKVVNSSVELPRMVGATKPGSESILTVWRKGAHHDLKVKVGEMPDEKAVKTAAKASAGLVVSALSAEQKKQLGIGNGVLVEEASGAAAKAGIQPGDVVMAVNNQEVNSAEQLAKLLGEGERKSVALLVKRGDTAHYKSLRLDDGK
jgi:serine protease Do